MPEKPTTGILTLVCTVTGGEINSGVVYNSDELARSINSQLLLHCRHCGKAHAFKFSDARLSPMRPGQAKE